MYICYIQSFKILASFCGWAGWFEPYLVETPRRHIFAWQGPFYEFMPRAAPWTHKQIISMGHVQQETENHWQVLNHSLSGFKIHVYEYRNFNKKQQSLSHHFILQLNTFYRKMIVLHVHAHIV